MSGYTVESVERALDVHEKAGRISAWSRVTEGRRMSWSIIFSGNTNPPGGSYSQLRDVYLICLGLTSAVNGTAGPDDPFPVDCAPWHRFAGAPRPEGVLNVP